jgi:hypothetical protein
MLKNQTVFAGGMAEWFKAAVLKTVERKLRGFESYSLRQFNLRIKTSNDQLDSCTELVCMF